MIHFVKKKSVIELTMFKRMNLLMLTHYALITIYHCQYTTDNNRLPSVKYTIYFKSGGKLGLKRLQQYKHNALRATCT